MADAWVRMGAGQAVEVTGRWLDNTIDINGEVLGTLLVGDAAIGITFVTVGLGTGDAGTRAEVVARAASSAEVGVVDQASGTRRSSRAHHALRNIVQGITRSTDRALACCVAHIAVQVIALILAEVAGVEHVVVSAGLAHRGVLLGAGQAVGGRALEASALSVLLVMP